MLYAQLYIGSTKYIFRDYKLFKVIKIISFEYICSPVSKQRKDSNQTLCICQGSICKPESGEIHFPQTLERPRSQQRRQKQPRDEQLQESPSPPPPGQRGERRAPGDQAEETTNWAAAGPTVGWTSAGWSQRKHNQRPSKGDSLLISPSSLPPRSPTGQAVAGPGKVGRGHQQRAWGGERI